MPELLEIDSDLVAEAEFYAALHAEKPIVQEGPFGPGGNLACIDCGLECEYSGVDLCIDCALVRAQAWIELQAA